MSCLVIFFLLTFTAPSICEEFNFIGSSITFSPGDNDTVLVDYRLSWLCEMSGYHCLNPGQGNMFLPCPTYDNDTTHFPVITCTDAVSHVFYRWTSARGRQVYAPGQNKYLSSFSAAKISVNFTTREDIGRINTSPTTDMIPIVMLQYGSKHRIKIPVGDVDGDLIKCRWSDVNLTDGCGDHCNGVIEATLDENKCEFEYFANKSTGKYIVALQIEDFMNSKSIQPLSSVPLQFFVHVYDDDYSIEGSGDVWTYYDIYEAFNESPCFISPTPKDGDCVEVEIHSSLKLEIVTNFTHKVRISTIKPVGMTSSNHSYTYNGPAIVTSVNITWTPSDDDGDRFHILCFYAYAYKETLIGEWPTITTETRCIRIVVKGPDWTSKGLSGLTCKVTECMLPAAKTLNITYVGLLKQKYTFGDTVIYKCNEGYQFVNFNRNKDSVTCTDTGKFADFHRCARVECKLPDLSQLNIEVNVKSRGQGTFYYGDAAVYECSQEYRFHDREKKKSVRCTATGMFEQFMECVKIPKCPEDSDKRGTYWNETLADMRANQTCSPGSTGSISRQCDSDGSWNEPYYSCVRTKIKQLTDTVGNISKKENPTAKEITGVIAQLTEATEIEEDPEDVNETLTSGEVAVLSSSLENIAHALNSTNDTTAVTNENITNNFFQSCDNLLDSTNQESWVAQTAETNSGAEKVLQAVDVLTEAIGRNLENETKRTVVKKNLALEVKKIEITEEKVVFPDLESLGNTTEKWIAESKSSISLNSDALTNKTVNYVTTAVMYKDLSEILPSTAVNVRNDTNKTPKIKDQGAEEEKRINGPILAMSIIPSVGKLDPPISITFQHFEEKLTQPACSFWEFEGNETGWSTEGCNVASSSEASTVCECNHLTNFAVLMSPFKEVEATSQALAIISIFGIAVSIFCLLLTLSIHVMFWKLLRNERTVILMNLCVALVISNITFLAGINETDNSTSCAVVAAFLQYIYLVAFCVMLVEGIIIALTIVYVFKTKRNTEKFLIPTWVVPGFIVGISVLATQGEGYGNKNYCWLSIENGLIWTFVGPVLIILVCNVVCLALVFRAMFKTTAMETKTAFEKVKTSFRCLCVLLPLMGLSWILGVFYVDERSAFIQYIFTILNAFQGFFIFLFHCLLNQQVKKALELRVRRFSASHTALRSFSSTSGKDGSGTKSNSAKRDIGKSIDEGTSVAKTEEKTDRSESAQTSV